MASSPTAPARRRALRTVASGLLSLAAPSAFGQSVRAPLQIVGTWEISGLASANSGYMFTRLQVTETLMDADDDGTPLPGLASAWTVSADRLTWRFALRPAARFHDGTALDSAAVVRCLENARTSPALLSVAPIESIRADGAKAVVIRLRAPFNGLTALLSHYATMVLAPSSFGPDGHVRAIVGTGPYRIVEVVPPARIETTIFEGYDGPRPAIERVRYLNASRAETRALMAESGQGDLVFGLDPASQQRLRTRPNVRVESVLLPRTVIVKLNAGLPSLVDPRVRTALSLSIDRVGIARALLRDPALAATQLFPPTLAAWNDPSLAPLAHDPVAARRLLGEAGWQRADDGLRDRDGHPLSLSLRTFPDRPELPIIAAALQEQWRQVGIAVRVDVSNFGDIPIGHRDGTLQLALAARNYANVPDPVVTLLQDFAATGGDWGAMGWHNGALNRALDRLNDERVPPDQAVRLRHDIVGVLQTELPIIPVTWYRLQVAVGKRLVGVKLDPLERSYRLTQMGWSA